MRSFAGRCRTTARLASNLLTGAGRFGHARLMHFAAVVVVAAGLAFSVSGLPAVEPVWPKLPERDGAVMIPAQEWPLRPGPRQVRVLVHYPEGTRASVGPRTGIFLTHFLREGISRWAF